MGNLLVQASERPAAAASLPRRACRRQDSAPSWGLEDRARSGAGAVPFERYFAGHALREIGEEQRAGPSGGRTPSPVAPKDQRPVAGATPDRVSLRAARREPG